MDKDILLVFLDELKAALGANLISATLYGSAVREKTGSGSDLNILVVVKEFSLDLLNPLEKVLERAERKGNIRPVFWAEKELRESADVFPLEFLEIKEANRVLYGDDIFAGIQAHTVNLRHQIEFELRSKILILRKDWLGLRGSARSLGSVLGRAGASFLHLAKHVEKISNQKPPEDWLEPFLEAIPLKKNEVRLKTAELEDLYRRVHDSAVRVAELVNHA